MCYLAFFVSLVVSLSLPRSNALQSVSQHLEDVGVGETSAETFILSRAHKLKRIALIVRGEAYRSDDGQNQQHSRDRNGSVPEQRSCTRTQTSGIVKPFEAAGVSVDVFSASYHTDAKRDAALVDVWNSTGALQKYTWCPEEGEQGDCAVTALRTVKKHIQKRGTQYDFILMIRHDMVIKTNAAGVALLPEQLLRRNWDKGLWLAPFKMTQEMRFFGDRVPDTVQAFSPQYLELMINVSRQWPYEDILLELLKEVDREHTGYIVQYFADSDPAKFQNPLYDFCLRDEGPKAPQYDAVADWLRTTASS